MSTLSENLRYYRTLSGKTIKQISNETGIPVPTYNGWELGNRVPRNLDDLDPIAKALDITKDMLLADRSQPRKDPQKARLESYLRGWENLNAEAQTKVLDYMDDLLAIDKYRDKK